MRGFYVIAVFVLVWQQSASRSLPEEESVVSVYTTLPSSTGTLDVYRQIAGNIADRITQPIYRFFGLDNSTKVEKTTKRPFEHIELHPTGLTVPERTSKTETKPNAGTDSKIDPQSNEIPDRDVEELSADFSQKSDKKPEKFTLFSSYLPVKGNFEVSLNDTKADLSDKSLELDDVEPEIDDDTTETGRGPFVYLLELIASIMQLIWGGFMNLFRPTTSTR